MNEDLYWLRENRDGIHGLDYKIEKWWIDDRKTGRSNDSNTLISVPYTYITPSGDESVFPELYYWDSYFIVRGLLVHNHVQLAKDQIDNLLYLANKYGFVPNGNRTFYLTRSQPPLLSFMVWAYFERTGDLAWLKQAYATCVKEFQYWTTSPHWVNNLLARWYDAGDPGLSPELASEAESGWDFTARFLGDAREWYASDLNALIYGIAIKLRAMACKLEYFAEEAQWMKLSEEIYVKINARLWDSSVRLYNDRHIINGKFSPVKSLASFYMLWTGAVPEHRARYLLDNLDLFNQEHGLSTTDREYNSPHSSLTFVQWGFPVLWAPLQLFVVEGLIQYGYTKQAEGIMLKYIKTVFRQYEKHGKLFEKYNAVDGSINVPVERYGNPPFHGWTAAVFSIFIRFFK